MSKIAAVLCALMLPFQAAAWHEQTAALEKMAQAGLQGRAGQRATVLRTLAAIERQQNHALRDVKGLSHLSDWTADPFSRYDGHLCNGAAGTAVLVLAYYRRGNTVAATALRHYGQQRFGWSARQAAWFALPSLSPADTRHAARLASDLSRLSQQCRDDSDAATAQMTELLSSEAVK